MAEAERQQLLARLARDINCLVDPDRFKRKRALETLSKELFVGPKAPSNAVRMTILVEDLQKQLLQLLADPIEMNREATITLFARFAGISLSSTDDDDGDTYKNISISSKAGGGSGNQSGGAGASSSTTSPEAAEEEEDTTTFPTLLNLLVPAFSSRIGRTPFPEDAEELRLQLAQLLNGLLLVGGGAGKTAAAVARVIKARFTDLVDILRALAADEFHSVKVEAATAMTHLAAAAPEYIHMSLGALATACVSNFGHQRGPVRLASLGALHVLLPLGGESLHSVMTQTAMPALRGLRFDRTPSVRRQLAVTVCHFHAALPDDIFASNEPGLVFLATGLMADETVEVAETALRGFEIAAKVRREAIEQRSLRFESSSGSGSGSSGGGGKGNASSTSAALTGDLAVAAEAAAPSTTIPGYQASLDGAEAMAMGLGGVPARPLTAIPTATTTKSGSGSVGGHNNNAVSVSFLPRPFQGPNQQPHPLSVDARWLTQHTLPSLLPLVLEELKEWTVKIRAWAAGALRSIFILAQGAIVSHLDVLIAALCNGSRDEEAEVRKTLGEVGRLLGVYVSPASQLGVLLPQLRGEVSGLNNGQHYAAALAVLSTAVSSMNREGIIPHLRDFAAVLALPSLAEDEPPPLRGQLAAVLAFTVRAASTKGITATTTRSSSSEDTSSSSTSSSSSSEAVVVGANLDAHDHWLQGPTPPLSSSRSHILPDEALDNLLRALLHVRFTSAVPEVAIMGETTTRELSKLLRYSSVADMYAARIHAVLPPIVSTAPTWVRSSYERRVFDTLLRVVRPALCGRNREEARSMVEFIINCFITTLNPSREAELRVAQLALLDSVISPSEGVSSSATSSSSDVALRGKPVTHAAAVAEVASGGHAKTLLLPSTSSSNAAGTLRGGYPIDGETRSEGGGKSGVSSGGGGGGGAHAISDSLVDEFLADSSGALLQHALLPNAIWRVGLVAATIRKVAIACIVSLGRRDLLPLHALEPVFEADALPVLKSCLGDDDATTRHLTCLAVSSMLGVLRGGLRYETVRTLYPELLKRLDDSNDAVRLSGCAAIRDLATAARHEDISGTPAEYTLDTLLIHLDDTNGDIQVAVYEAILPYAKLQPDYAIKAVKAARDKHRHPGYCDQLLSFLLSATGAATKNGGANTGTTIVATTTAEVVEAEAENVATGSLT